MMVKKKMIEFWINDGQKMILASISIANFNEKLENKKNSQDEWSENSDIRSKKE